MNITKDQWTQIARALLTAALAIASILGYDIAIVQPREAAIAAAAQPLIRGVSHFTELEADTVKAAAPTAVGTATPALMTDSLGVSNLFEIRDAATPVWYAADGGNVTHTGNYALTGDHAVSGLLTVTDELLIGATAAISITTGGTITPTGSFQLLESAGNVGAALSVSGYTTGDFLLLTNTSNTTITITDTGTAKLESNWAGSQYDQLLLIFDGTNWLEITRGNS